MMVVGALLGTALVSFLLSNAISAPYLFWVFFTIGAIVSIPVSLVLDAAYRNRLYHERCADKRQESMNETLKVAATIAAQRYRDEKLVMNIDARSVHIHQENKARRGFIDKP